MDQNSSNEAKNSSHAATELQPTRDLSAAQPAFRVGDRVLFADERGTRRSSVITRIVPVGEYSATELGYAIRASYGSYVRVASEITLDTQSSEARVG